MIDPQPMIPSVRVAGLSCANATPPSPAALAAPAAEEAARNSRRSRRSVIGVLPLFDDWIADSLIRHVHPRQTRLIPRKTRGVARVPLPWRERDRFRALARNQGEGDARITGAMHAGGRRPGRIALTSTAILPTDSTRPPRARPPHPALFA